MFIELMILHNTNISLLQFLTLFIIFVTSLIVSLRETLNNTSIWVLYNTFGFQKLYIFSPINSSITFSEQTPQSAAFKVVHARLSVFVTFFIAIRVYLISSFIFKVELHFYVLLLYFLVSFYFTDHKY